MARPIAKLSSIKAFSTTTAAAASAAARQGAEPLSTAGVAFFSSLCISTFGLGWWQATRYFEKIDMMERREKELAMDPMDTLEKNAKCSMEELQLQDDEKGGGGGAFNTANHENDNDNQTNAELVERGFQRIAVEGEFRHHDEILVGPRGPPPGVLSSTGPNSGRSGGNMSTSPQGFYVLTPFERSNGMGTILVNRGWVPRQYVQQSDKSSKSAKSVSNPSLSWKRPSGILHLVGVPSKTEIPRFMSPPHNTKEPKQLLWMDRKEIESRTNTAGLAPLLLIETKRMLETETDYNNGGTSSTYTESSSPFPAQPSVETVGEFKVTPTTHAGYAFTWFGLSGAGVIMTRKLVTRGRG